MRIGTLVVVLAACPFRAAGSFTYQAEACVVPPAIHAPSTHAGAPRVVGTTEGEARPRVIPTVTVTALLLSVKC